MKRDLSEGANETSRGTGGPTGLFARLERAIQRGFGDLEGLANLLNWVPLVVEILSNTELFASEGFGSTALSPSGSGSSQSSLCPFPDKVSLKLRKRTEDVENQLAATDRRSMLCSWPCHPIRNHQRTVKQTNACLSTSRKLVKAENVWVKQVSAQGISCLERPLAPCAGTRSSRLSSGKGG
jgi:hypothetical protein